MNRVANRERAVGKVTSNGEIILADVAFRIEHTIDDNSGFKGWYGTFDPEEVIDTDSYHLILNDGREGTISVTNVDISNRSVHAQFNGLGPLK